MVGMMFGVDWVKKLCVLVKFLWIYECLKDERCLWMTMKEEEEKFCSYTYLVVAHGRANIGTGRAISL